MDTALLRFILDPALSPPATEGLLAWWDATAFRRASWAAPFDRALAGGAYADRLGFAFAAGYAEALRALLPDLPPGTITALCATEEGGAHPRAIHTRLEQASPGYYRLSGRKKWATVGTIASSLLVIASTGEEEGKNRLRAVRVRASAPGVRFRSSAAAFVPEIPHAEVDLDNVILTDADVLPGDGYDSYLKPFRTIEDIHVHAALAGYLIGVARRRRFPHEICERLLALAGAARAISRSDPKAETTHAVLGGVLELASQLVAEIESLWSAAPDEEWARWQRDRRLLHVAGNARDARRARAWSILDGTAETAETAEAAEP